MSSLLGQVKRGGAGIHAVYLQIIDDVLDVTQSTETLGKPAKSDEKAKKSTYTSLLGVEQAKSQAEDLLWEALSMLARAELKHELLERKNNP